MFRSNASKGIAKIRDSQSPYFPKVLNYMIFKTMHVFPNDFSFKAKSVHIFLSHFLINKTNIFANFKRCILAIKLLNYCISLFWYLRTCQTSPVKMYLMRRDKLDKQIHNDLHMPYVIAFFVVLKNLLEKSNNEFLLLQYSHSPTRPPPM